MCLTRTAANKLCGSSPCRKAENVRNGFDPTNTTRGPGLSLLNLHCLKGRSCFCFSLLLASRVVAKVIDVGKVPQKERLACIQEVKVSHYAENP